LNALALVYDLDVALLSKSLCHGQKALQELGIVMVATLAAEVVSNASAGKFCACAETIVLTICDYSEGVDCGNE
jgi:hypothetical protein